MRSILVLLLLLTSAFAESNEIEYLKRAITAIETQRNIALTAQVVAEAKLGQVLADLEKANVRLKELESKDK